jgi:hypothetical protein
MEKVNENRLVEFSGEMIRVFSGREQPNLNAAILEAPHKEVTSNLGSYGYGIEHSYRMGCDRNEQMILS